MAETENMNCSSATCSLEPRHTITPHVSFSVLVVHERLFDTCLVVTSNILTIKPTRCTDFSKFIFGLKLHMFRSVPLSIIRSIYCTHSNGICHTGLLIACEQDQDGSFIPQINFEKLVHLVGFIIRIYHDARSPERQIHPILFTQKPFLQLFFIIRPNNDDDYCFYSSVWFHCVSKLDNRSVIENRRSEQERTNNVIYPEELCSTGKWPHIPENKRQTELVHNSVKGHLQCNTYQFTVI